MGKTAQKASAPTTDDAPEEIDDDFFPAGGGAAETSPEAADPEHFPGILEGLSPDYIVTANFIWPPRVNIVWPRFQGQVKSRR